ncbi:hypothetical protein [Thomasclavelia sp.]|uniref:hypothetical protein n=1 Tax=Thomasclavelia sp. TaxID=3025757 RepID=UPI0025EA2D1C|nr:hypothetical protein [Thomasclavelia sp.]
MEKIMNMIIAIICGITVSFHFGSIDNQVKSVGIKMIEASKIKNVGDNFYLDVESVVDLIRLQYYIIQENPNDYTKQEQNGLSYYLNNQGKTVKICGKATSLNLSFDKDYNVEYYYEDSNLRFVFIYDGLEEYRFYIYKNKCIRYIDSNGTITDYNRGIDANEISELGKFIEVGIKL